MRWRWHPLLFAVYPVLFLYARNSGNLPVHVLWRPVATAFVFGLVVWAVARRLATNPIRGALLATGVLVAWSAYGHVHQMLGESAVGQHRVLLPVWIVLVVLMIILARRGMTDTDRTLALSRLAVWVGLALMAWPVINVVEALRREPDPYCRLGFETPRQSGIPPEKTGRDADIYHIVLDGYGRADVLRDLYGHDNVSFLEALRKRGFCVADRARANYTQTLLSVVSSFGYPVTEFEQDPMSNDRRPLARKLRSAMRNSALQSTCDWTRAFASGYAATEILDADLYLSPTIAINEFERGLIASTPLDVAVNLLESHFGDVLHRRVVEFAFTNLAVARDDPPNAFTFAHIVAPHPPFVFAPPSTTAGAMVPLADGDHVVCEGGLTVDQYRAAYRAQVEAVNARMLESLDVILANGRESIILLHGDHGPGSLLKWDERIPDPAAARERLGILLAVRFPGPVNDICLHAKSPMGARSGIWNRMWGVAPEADDFPSFFSTWTHPYDFVEIGPDGQVVTP